MRVTGRAVLAALLHLAFFLLPIGAVLGLLLTAALIFRNDTGAGLRTGIVAVVVGTVIWIWLRAVTRPRVRWRGVPLEEEDQPRLWKLIGKLAGAVGTGPPDEVRVVSEVTVRVRQESRLLGLRRGRCHLEIGLPLLAGLSVAEFRAALAHELSLLGASGSRTRALVRRCTIAIERTAEAMPPGAMKWLFEGYARWYAWLAAPVNRALELRADVDATALVGKRAARAASRRVGGVDTAWHEYCRRYLSLVPLAERTPDLLLGFRSFLDHPERAEQLEEYAENALDTDHSGRYLRRPTTRERLTVIDHQRDTETRRDNRPGWALLREPRDTVPELEQRLLVDGLGPRVPWPELVRLAGAAHSRNRAGLLTRAIERTGRAPDATIQGILLAIHQGHGTALMDSVMDPGMTEDEVRDSAVDLLSELLGEAVVSALVADGRARHQLDWERAWRVRLADGSEFDAAGLVRPAVENPAFVPGLHRALVSLGVSLDFAAPVAEDPQPALRGIVTAVQYEERAHDLLVFDKGLLLLPAPGGTAQRLLAGALARARRSEEEHLDELAAAPLEDLRQQPEAVWSDTHEIGYARLVQRRSGWSLTVDVYDPGSGDDEARELVLASTGDTGERGDPYAGLGELMGARMEIEGAQTESEEQREQ